MAVDVRVSRILDRFAFPVSQKIVEKYYRRKLNNPCFLLKQHDRWTIVTVNYP